jgi:hypothetical protein
VSVPLACMLVASCEPRVEAHIRVGESGGVDRVRVCIDLECSRPGTASLYPSLASVFVSSWMRGFSFFTAKAGSRVSESLAGGKTKRGSIAILVSSECCYRKRVGSNGHVVDAQCRGCVTVILTVETQCAIGFTTDLESETSLSQENRNYQQERSGCGAK